MDALEARIRLDLGEPGQAADLARRLPPSPTRCLLEARAWLVQGQADRADVTMSGLDVDALGVRLAIEHSLLRAEVRRHLGLRYDDELGRLVGLGRPQGFVLSVLDVSAGLRDELVALLRHSPGDTYADSLLRASDRMAAHSTAGSPLGDAELSAREQGVLRYLQTRLTTREIAGELHLDEHPEVAHQEHLPQARCDIPVRRRRPRQDGRFYLSVSELTVVDVNHPRSGDDSPATGRHTEICSITVRSHGRMNACVNVSALEPFWTMHLSSGSWPGFGSSLSSSETSSGPTTRAASQRHCGCCS